MNPKARPYVIAGAFVVFAIAALTILWASMPASAAAGNIRVSCIGSVPSATCPTDSSAVAPAPLNTNFTIALTQNADVVTSGAQADITFNTAAIEIVSVQLGSAYTGGTLVLGNTIAQANSTGVIQDAAAFLVPPASVPAGDAQFLTITLQAQQCGISNITLSQLEMLDSPNGSNIPVTGTNGSVSGISTLDFNPPAPATPDGVRDWQGANPDADCDASRDSHETTIGTNPNGLCAANGTANNEAGADMWPLDFDDNQRTNTLDLTGYATRLGSTPGPGSPYGIRWDLRDPIDNVINTLDLIPYASLLGKFCTR